MIYHAVDPVYFIGDLHGNFHWIKPFIEKHDLRDCTLVLCGDVGLGFRKLSGWLDLMRELKLTKCLRSRKIVLYFIRGNHDDPSWFNDTFLNTSCFKAVSDYSVICTPAHNILCIGGGISPDRYQRRLDNNIAISKYLKYHPHKTKKEAMQAVQLGYWENENPKFCPQKIDALTAQIDIVCSHVAPTFLSPASSVPKKWLEVDPGLKRDCCMERKIMDKVFQRLRKQHHPVKYWYYGHYHRYEMSEGKGITGYMLDMARDNRLCLKEAAYGS